MLYLSRIAIFAISVCLCSTQGARAQARAVATAFVVEGSVLVRPGGEAEWRSLAKGKPLHEGDTIKTGDDGKAALEFVDGAFVRLGRNSAITLNEVAPQGDPQVTQTSGTSYFFSRGARREPQIKTPLVNATIRGTELVVIVDPEMTTIDVLHGSAQISSGADEEVASAGESVTAKRGEPLKKTILVHPADAVQWMIRFPFIVTSHDIAPAPDAGCSTSCVRMVEKAIGQATEGSLYHAVEALPADLKESPRGVILKSVALWSVGDKAAAFRNLELLPGVLSPAMKRCGASSSAMRCFSIMIWRGQLRGCLMRKHWCRGW